MRNDAAGTADSSRALTPLGRRIRAASLRKGWDVGELARRAGISRTTLYHLERGVTSRPRASTLQRLAQALEVDPAELAGKGSGGGSSIRDAADHPAGGALRDAWADRSFDRDTNAAVAEVFERRPALFSGWSASEWDELYSSFGTGGPLTDEGVIHSARQINSKRETVRQLHIVMETHLSEVAASVIETLYRMVRPESNLAAGEELAALLEASRLSVVADRSDER